MPRRPKPALAALYWQLTRRKVRARNRLRAACAEFPFAYRDWITKKEGMRDLTTASCEWEWKPRFLILLHGAKNHSKEELARSLRSVDWQIYRASKVIQGEPHDLDASLLDSDYDYVVPLRTGDELAASALFQFAEALQINRGAAILYGDHDELDIRGRRSRPWFKPEWNEELFLSQDYLSSAVALQAQLVRDTLETNQPELVCELVLGAAMTSGRMIVHIPHILTHVRGYGAQKQWLSAVERHLAPLGASCSPGPFGTVKVEWPLPEDLPLVSIIVPTKDKVALLRACLTSVLHRTDYKNFEIIIVDNGSVEKETAAYLNEVQEDARVRVLPYPGAYNFSAINNFAVEQARGSFLCLLNNDTEVMETTWLSELMRYAVRPDVGAVGAKLLYDNGSIQHAGVVVGIGDAAGHAHRYLPADRPGYFRMPHVAHFVSAVTAACLVVEKQKFTSVGGLDETDLAVAFNDVDLCLKIEAAGWRNVYVPHAVLVHHESKSRGKDISPKNIHRYQKELRVLQQRWGTKTYSDPLHNPNLDRYSETFVIAL